MDISSETCAYPPETLEGWFALHQVFAVDRAKLSVASAPQFDASLLNPASAKDGWTGVAKLIGSSADIMVIHFRPTLDALGEAQDALRTSPISDALRPVYSFLSVTEAGLYHLTAQLAREAIERGGSVGDELYAAELGKRAATERATAHMARRLFPPLPPDLPYVCFYPMSKRRAPEQNWYSLSLDERSRLMHTHGRTGRRYAGRVQQVISGAIGFDAWEWGVTLFAKDPLDFKRLVTDMRFDEVSAKYAEFGTFYVGRMTEWSAIAG